jgi:hypothetical protein
LPLQHCLPLPIDGKETVKTCELKRQWALSMPALISLSLRAGADPDYQDRMPVITDLQRDRADHTRTERPLATRHYFNTVTFALPPHLLAPSKKRWQGSATACLSWQKPGPM